MKTSSNNTMRRFAIDCYGGTLIVTGLLNILWAVFAFKMIDLYGAPWFTPFIKWFPLAAFVSGLSLVTFPMNLIIGYGLLRRREWARVGVIAAIISLPIALICEVLWWDYLRLNGLTATVLIGASLPILVFFLLPSVIGEFDESAAPTAKRLNRSVPIIVVILAFAPVIISEVLRLGYRQVPPVTISKMTLDKGGTREGLKPVRLLDASLMLPEQVGITSIFPFEGQKGKWSITFRNKGIWMVLENTSLPEQVLDKLPVLGGSGLNLEKFVNTNRWNPMVMLIRSIGRPYTEKYEMSEIEVSGKKGFFTLLGTTKNYFFEFSLYDPQKKRSLSGFIKFEDPEQGKRLMPAIMSSISFANPEAPEKASEYFRQAEILERSGNEVEAQYAYFSALYLAPDNATYKERISSLAAKHLQDVKGAAAKR
jgi:hypothetical protein